MSETRLRCGRKVHRTLYEHTPDDPDGRLVGMVDSAELAAEIVQAVNARRDAGFYEDDEPLTDLHAAWDRGVPRTTTAPGSVGTNAHLDTSADEVARLQSRLRAATRFEIGPATVTRQRDGAWRVSWPDPRYPGFRLLTEDHHDRDTAMARARQIAQETQ